MNPDYLKKDWDSLIGHLIEEMGEVSQNIGKMMKWGTHSFNPYDLTQETNAEAIIRECDDVEKVIWLLRTAYYNDERFRDIRLKKYGVEE